jgi:hypothetical protein
VTPPQTIQTDYVFFWSYVNETKGQALRKYWGPISTIDAARPAALPRSAIVLAYPSGITLSFSLASCRPRTRVYLRKIMSFHSGCRRALLLAVLGCLVEMRLARA